ncbi:hypothetical protein ASD64_14685 [Mesorhizobium sp. Root157]|uniref:hypothetical protein n=1 Tax=Mesorhizobium sp. Root157 TaxID=1736477 RepID=UPI0006F29DC6|nr:hypothetical protein [Mesorhizobium sp. Root157]KQZ99575.1 hypothetical protein ASD64_14685 [Mesorhizobium sp. Root157]
MDSYDIAHASAERTAGACVALGIDPTITADALLTVALATWAAETDRLADAIDLLTIWTEVRDGR